MGQSASTSGIPSSLNRHANSNPNPSRRMKNRSTDEISVVPIEDSRICSYESSDEDGEAAAAAAAADLDLDAVDDCPDLISDLPDECLALVFQSLGAGDRKRCSLVCRRWLQVDGQSRHRLSLDARSDIQIWIPSIFERFDSISKLALKCDRRSVSIGDEALVLISLRCKNLARFKIRGCREITEVGMEELARNCRNLKKLSCGSCSFGARGINAFLDHAAALEELSVKRLRGLTDGAAMEPIGPGAAASTLKTICLKELYNGQCFESLILGAKSLKTLKLFRCSGDWDRVLESISVDRVAGLREVHLERLQVSDCGLAAISSCLDLEILHLVKTPECTNAGLTAIAERCKLLRKLHIDGWKTNRIGDEGLAAIARRCPNLQELVLIGVNPTSHSIGLLTSNCRNLERLALCNSETIGDAEISCIATKCLALRKLCIKGCPVSDLGMEALAGGCPNLVKVKVKKCREVTSEGAEWLRSNRASLAVNLDIIAAMEPQDAGASDGEAQEIGGEQQYPSVIKEQTAAADVPSSSSSSRRSAFSKAKIGLLARRNFVASTIRRWSQSNSNPQ